MLREIIRQVLALIGRAVRAASRANLRVVALTTRQVVKGFGAVRVGLGVAFAIAPRRLSRGEDVLMTRSFAVREIALGLGGLLAGSHQIRDWARAGALVDIGDIVASAAAVRRRTPMAVPSLLTAAVGFSLEVYAAHRPDPPPSAPALGAHRCTGDVR